jgi:hypothetical protein
MEQSVKCFGQCKYIGCYNGEYGDNIGDVASEVGAGIPTVARFDGASAILALKGMVCALIEDDEGALFVECVGYDYAKQLWWPTNSDWDIAYQYTYADTGTPIVTTADDDFVHLALSDLLSWTPNGLGGGGLTVCVFDSTTDGHLQCYGQVEIDDDVDVTDLSIESVQCSHSHCCAKSTGTTLVCWGDNDWGQISVSDLGFDDVQDYSITGSSTCALSTDGKVGCIGRDYKGQLGGNLFDIASSSFTTDGLRMAHGFGSLHFCIYEDAIEPKLQCWGYNSQGQLGYADQTDRDGTSWDDVNLLFPAPTPEATIPCSISVSGFQHVVANGEWVVDDDLTDGDDVVYSKEDVYGNIVYLWQTTSNGNPLWVMGTDINGDSFWGYRWGSDLMDACDSDGECASWYYSNDGEWSTHSVEPVVSCSTDTDVPVPVPDALLLPTPASSHYVALGNSIKAAIDEVVFYCADNEDGVALFELNESDIDTLQVGCCTDDSSTGFRPGYPSCTDAAHTYSEAVALCESHDARLCTLQEMLSGATKGGGCRYGTEYHWVSDECDSPMTVQSGQYIAVSDRAASKSSISESVSGADDESNPDGNGVWRRVVIGAVIGVVVIGAVVLLAVLMMKRRRRLGMKAETEMCRAVDIEEPLPNEDEIAGATTTAEAVDTESCNLNADCE